MAGGRDATIIRNLANVPEKLHAFDTFGEFSRLRIALQDLQHVHIFRWRRLGQAFHRGWAVEREAQRVHRAEIERAVAPLQHAHRREGVILERFDQLILERIDLTGDAEGAVARMPAGAPGNLAEFRRAQAAILVAVELALLREGDMLDIEIETHADRVGRNEEIDVARLEQFDLGIARARAERAEHDGRAAALATDQLGDRIDLVGREGDNRRAPRQTRDLFRAGIGEQ